MWENGWFRRGSRGKIRVFSNDAERDWVGLVRGCSWVSLLRLLKLLQANRNVGYTCVHVCIPQENNPPKKDEESVYLSELNVACFSVFLGEVFLVDLYT